MTKKHVDSMNQCAGKASNVGVGVMGATGATMVLPRSLSINSFRRDDNDAVELVRAAS